MSESEKLLVIGCAGLGIEPGRGVNPSEVIAQRLHNTEIASYGVKIETIVSDCELEEYPDFFASIADKASRYCGILAIEADNVSQATAQLVAHNYIDTTQDGRTFGRPRKNVVIADGKDTLKSNWLSCFEPYKGSPDADIEWLVPITRDKHTLRANALSYSLLRALPWSTSAVLRIPYDGGSARILEQEDAVSEPILPKPIENSLEAVMSVASEMACTLQGLREAFTDRERFFHDRETHPTQCPNC